MKNLSLILCGAFLIVAVAVCSANVASAKPEYSNSIATQWEHLALTHAEKKFDGKLAKQINELGDQGWQLVDVSTVVVEGTTEKTIFCFKRQK